MGVGAGGGRGKRTEGIGNSGWEGTGGEMMGWSVADEDDSDEDADECEARCGWARRDVRVS